MVRSFTIVFTTIFFVAAAAATEKISPSQSPQTAPTSAKERGIELFNQGQINESLAALRRAVKENKEDYEVWQFLGLALIRSKQLKEASKCFETALKLRPQFGPGHAGLAYSL